MTFIVVIPLFIGLGLVALGILAIKLGVKRWRQSDVGSSVTLMILGCVLLTAAIAPLYMLWILAQLTGKPG